MVETQAAAVDGALRGPTTGRFLETGNATGVEYIAGDGPADRLAIIFGSMGAFDFRQDLLAQAGLIDAHFDILAIRPVANGWYQDVSELLMATILADLPEYRERFVLGADMGGYAALYFASALKATRVLAFSPVFSQDPAVAPWEDRWPPLAPDERMHRPMAVALEGVGAEVRIVYDPQTHDRDHVALFAARLPQAEYTPVAYSDSPTSAMLDELGLLTQYAVAVAQGTHPVDAATLRSVRRRSALHLKALALAAIQHGHVETGETLLERSLDVRRGVDTLLIYGRHLAESRRPAAALPYIDEAIRQMPPHAHFMALRAHLEELVGDLAAAADSYALAAQYDPGVAEFRQSEARVLRSLIALNRGQVMPVGDDRSALAQLDELKKQKKMGDLDLRKILAGIGLSLGIVLAFWVLAGIFEWR